MLKLNQKITLSLIVLATSSNLFADSSNQSSTPPDFPDYKLEQITNLIKASDMHRLENQQKKLTKQLHKKNNTFNTYAQPKFLSQKKMKNTFPKAQKVQNINNTFTAQSNQYKISIPLSYTGDIVLKKITAKAFKKAKSKKTKDTYNFTVSLPKKILI